MKVARFQAPCKGPTSPPGIAGSVLLAHLNQHLRELIREELRAAQGEGGDDPLLRSDQCGLGSNRKVLQLIREGELSACKVGTRYFVRRSERDRFAELHQVKRKASPEAPSSAASGAPANDAHPSPPAADDAEADVDAVLEELDLERAERRTKGPSLARGRR
jgi:excisionase family DNA binding protein